MVVALILAGLLAGAVSVADAPHPAVVALGKDPSGKLVTDARGLPLYTWDGNGLNSDCVDACLEAWPALLAAKEDKPVGEWEPRPRPGGALQWSYKGAMVYRFARDAAGGAASGDGIGGAWHALAFAGATPHVAVPPAAQVIQMGDKFLLADAQGRALYTFKRDGKAPACRAECLEVWPPLLAPAAAGALGAWTAVERPDGIRQWAYRGRLVYRFSDDALPGDARGAGAGGVWQTIAVTDRDAQPDKTQGRAER